MTFKVAAAQIDIALGDPDRNYQTVTQAVKDAAKAGADVVVFPEMWNTGYTLTELARLADQDGWRTKQTLARAAKENQIAIVGGSVATVRAGGQYYNTTYVYDETGQLIGSYDKVHLFGLMHEDQFIQAGDHGNVFELKGVKSASFICYDLRFPEWFRTVAKQGADVIYVVAEWPTPRIEQWEALVKARAIENQAFVVAVNRVGHDAENSYNGHSLVVDPLGNVIANAGEKAGLTLAELDLDELKKVRGPIPVFKDRRPDLYD
ncbi:carbon-nitrogen family hydrolase [Limosilactobacillus mucosae]|uniref:carbon-nitrogen family hydrolase n=1 Tax=Limosilactobacillus mucosae TaxID=97478 RepID=UPI00087E95E3|nr:carbon-nitrogen family hydrolase [Limosilactobacillus mucosae]SDN06387.1 Predicted amidohydrolase [Limosilactobacillus mucosae]SEK37490.1 Predicted amidohydrolase [Limosilactobacillus mucosae]SFJ94855.1 Predicted amidohydrolase [Limosilactobacillus mucosae]